MQGIRSVGRPPPNAGVALKPVSFGVKKPAEGVEDAGGENEGEAVAALFAKGLPFGEGEIRCGARFQEESNLPLSSMVDSGDFRTRKEEGNPQMRGLPNLTHIAGPNMSEKCKYEGEKRTPRASNAKKIKISPQGTVLNFRRTSASPNCNRCGEDALLSFLASYICPSSVDCLHKRS